MIAQRSARPQDLDAAEADLLVMAEQSKQKYLDIVGRLQKESLKSESAYVDESVEDHEEENTIEDEYELLEKKCGQMVREERYVKR